MSVRESVEEAFKTLNRFMVSDQVNALERIGETLVKHLLNGGKILTCGNGGSYCDALHFASELTGKYKYERKPLPAICLANAAHLTCVGNDFGFEAVFKREVAALARSWDIVLFFSTSGQSRNLVMAAHQARDIGVTCIGILGKSGGKLAEIVNDSIIVESQNTDRVQEIHGVIVHLLVEYIEREMFPENYIDP